MADITKTIEIIFGAKDDSFSSKLRSIETQLNTFDSGAQNIADPFASFTEGLLKTEAAVASLAALYGGYALNEAIKFQTAQNDLNKVLSDSEPSVESFTSVVTDLSEKYGISSDIILQGIANFKQAGFTAQESADLQKQALDLIIAGDLDAATASETLISSIKGFASEASSASRYIEAMNNVSNDYATDVRQLAEGMSRVAPIAKIMGFSFEETAGVLTPMIEIFGNGTFAAEAFKTGLLKLIDDSGPVTKALAQIGVSQTDLNGQLRSGKDIFYDVAKAFETLDQNQKLFIASQLIGIDQAPRMIVAFNDLAKIQEITQAAYAETDSVTKEVQIRLDSAAKQIDIMQVAFRNLARVIGAEVINGFSGVIGGVTEIERSFRHVVEQGGLNPLIEAIKPKLAELEALLKTAAKNFPEAFKGVDFSGLISALNDLGGEFSDSFRRIFDGVDLSTVNGLRNAIQTTINIITSLVNVTSSIIDQFSPIFDSIGLMGDQISNSSEETSNSVGKLLGAMTILGEFGTSLGTLLLIIKNTESDISNVFDMLVGGSRIFTNGLQVSFDSISYVIANSIKGWTSNLATFLDAIGADETAAKLRDISGEFSLVADGIAENLKSNAADMEDGWNQMVRGISSGSDSAAVSMQKVSDTVEIPKAGFQSLGIDVKELQNKFSEFGFSLDPITGKIESVGNASGRTDEEIRKLIDAANGVTDSNKRMEASFVSLTDAEDAAAKLADEGYKSSIVYSDGLYILSTAQVTSSQSAKQLADETKKAALEGKEGSKEWKTVQDVMIETQKVTDDFKIKMGELANKRYEIDVKANVDLRTAEIESETARIASAYKGITDAVSALAPEVTNLWSVFGEKAGFTGGKEIQRAAERMDERLEQELELKRQLTEVTIEKMRAETERLTSGEALIQIDAGDLAPELELVFDKILKYTQVKASQQGLALLVGL